MRGLDSPNLAWPIAGLGDLGAGHCPVGPLDLGPHDVSLAWSPQEHLERERGGGWSHHGPSTVDGPAVGGWRRAGVETGPGERVHVDGVGRGYFPEGTRRSWCAVVEGSAGERIDGPAVMPHGEVDVGVVGFAGPADSAEAIAGDDLGAWFDRDGAPQQVAEIDLPGIPEVEHDAVAALVVVHRGCACGQQLAVWHSVAGAEHSAGGWREHPGSNGLPDVAYGEVGAGVVVVGAVSAGVVAKHIGRAVDVGPAADPAVLADLARDRQREGQRWRGTGGIWAAGLCAAGRAADQQEHGALVHQVVHAIPGRRGR